MQYVRSILCTVFVFLVIAGISYADSGKPKSDVRFFSAEVLKILALPENEIDVGLAALVFAKEVYPEISVSAYSAKIDLLADEAKRAIQRRGKYDSESVLRMLNSYYHRVHGIQYDKSADARQKQENYFIKAMSLLTVDPVLFPVRRAERRVA